MLGLPQNVPLYEDAWAVLDSVADAVRGAVWLADVVRFTCCEIAEVEGTVGPGLDKGEADER